MRPGEYFGLVVCARHEELRDQRGPARLMRGADATARIAVEVLVEGNVVPVVGIGLLLGAVMPERALARGVLQEDVREAAAELVRDLLDGEMTTRAGRALDHEGG